MDTKTVTIVELNFGDVFLWEGKEIQVQDQMYVMNGKVISLYCAPEGKVFLSSEDGGPNDCVTLEDVPILTKVRVVKPVTDEMLDTLEGNLFGRPLRSGI
jgi:hypothetical protein